ncbi:MAG: hypothetical protein HDS20_03435 [Bacteroides sp.]|nr:hypothetical protein [Bacteroides sp.]
MLTSSAKPSRPERFILSPAFSIFLGLCGAVISLFRADGIAGNVALLLSLILGAVAAVQVRPRAMFKGTGYPLFPTFMLLQAAAPGSPEGVGLALFAFGSLIVYFFCFSQPQFTRTFFLLFLLTGIGAVFSPAWLLWAAVSIAVMVTLRAFSMRGLVASLLGLLTAFILIPVIAVASSQSLEPLFSLAETFQHPLFDFPLQLSDNYIFSASICALLGLATFLTAYGYPSRMRAQNMAVYVVAAGAVIFPVFTLGGSNLWLPLINLCAAYFASHFIAANKRAGWVLALIIWIVIIGFIVKELCGL